MKMRNLSKVILGLCLLVVEFASMNADAIFTNASLDRMNNISKLNDTISGNATAESLVMDGTCTLGTVGTLSNKTMKVGEVIIADPPECYKIECPKANHPIAVGCEDITVKENCLATFYDMKSNYPKCCPKEVC